MTDPTSDLPPDVRDRAAQAAREAGTLTGMFTPEQYWGNVVDAVAEVLTKDSALLSRADAKWLCDVIHGEPDTGPAGETRYNRAHKLLEP
jgi:hypothetical protein